MATSSLSPPSYSPPSPRSIVVFSGGTAANSLVDVFTEVAQKKSSHLKYIIPISDNGGSSSELIRVFGGPGIGDIRSRLIRLIPPTHTPILHLLNHRLPTLASLALSEWHLIVSNLSPLWTPIPSPQRELIRSMLSHLNLEILKRARPNPTSTFNFASASIGNLFLTGARLFTGSFESAIYLLGVVGGVSETVSVLPVINSNFSHHISAGLVDGTTIVGQNAISHPSEPTSVPNQRTIDGTMTPHDDVDLDPDIEDANLPGSLPTLRKPQISFSKTEEEDLPARIERIWYINPYGQEMRPAANPKVVDAVRGAEAVIYSIGSLYTSIIPCLILRGVGAALATTMGLKYKILILNGSVDRETGPSNDPLDAGDFVTAIARAGEESQGHMNSNKEVTITDQVRRMYVTHLIYLEGEGTPRIDRGELQGIECVRLYGRKGEDGKMRYDGKALGQTLEAILGKGGNGGRSRRNTLEG